MTINVPPAIHLVITVQLVRELIETGLLRELHPVDVYVMQIITIIYRILIAFYVLLNVMVVPGTQGIPKQYVQHVIILVKEKGRVHTTVPVQTVLSTLK